MQKTLWIALFLSITLLAQESKFLYITKISIAPKKSNKKYWDLWKGAPDLKIIIYFKKNDKWQSVYTSSVYKNTYTIDEIIETKLRLSKEQKIRVRVIDKDVAENDRIGLGVWQIGNEFSSEKQYKVKFHSVLQFNYFLSKYKTIEIVKQKHKEEQKKLERIQQAKKHCKQVEVLLQNKEYARALEQLQRAIKADNTYPWIKFYQGYIAFYQNDLEQALTALNSFISLETKHAPAYFYRSQVYLKQNKIKPAFTDINQAINLSSQVEYCIYRMKLYQKQKQFSKAAIDATRLLKILEPKKRPEITKLAQQIVKQAIQNTPIELTVQRGHNDQVTTTTFTPDGKNIVSGSKDKTIKLWDIKGKLIRTFYGHSRAIDFVNCNSDRVLISTSYDKLKIWDLVTGELIHTFSKLPNLYKVALSPDGKTIAFINQKNIELWNIYTDKLIQTFSGHSNTVQSVTFSVDGKILASTSKDKTLKLWNTTTGKLIHNLSGYTNTTFKAVFSADGKTIAGASYKTLKIWNITTGKPICTFSDKYYYISAIAFNPDSKTIAISWNKSIKLYNIATGKHIHTFYQNFRFSNSKGHSYTINKIIFSPDGKTMASTSSKAIKLWSLQNKKLIQTFPWYAVAFSPDSKAVVVSSYSKTLKLWDLRASKINQIYYGDFDSIKSIAFSPDGKNMATTGTTVKLWDFTTGKVKRSYKGLSAAFSPDNQTIAIGEHRAIKIRDIETNQIKKGFYKFYEKIDSIAFSPDNKNIVVGRKLQLLDVNKNLPKRTFWKHSDWVKSVAFSANNKNILSVYNNKFIQVWDINKNLPIHSFFGQTAAFAPNGKTTAFANDKIIKLWDKKFTHTISGHTAYISSLAFNTTGRTLASASWDRTIKLWNTSSGKLKHSFSGHAHYINSIAFSPHNKILVSGSNIAIKLWKLDSHKLLLSLYSFGKKKDWLAVTSKGFFDGTAEALKQLHFVKGLQTYELEQFFENFYRPGLYQEVISGRHQPKEININQLLALSPPPKVEVIAPSKSKEKQVKVLVKITNTGGGIHKIRLFHNSKLTSSDEHKKQVQKNQSITKEFTISLLKGKNIMKATAFSSRNIEAKAAQVTITYTTPKIIKPRLYGLVVGVNQYEDANLNLNYARPDATSIKSTLIQNASKIYQRFKISSLYDNKATKKNIIRILDKIISVARAEDVVILYFSGHGETVQEKFYFLPHETKQVYEKKNIVKYGLSTDILGQKAKQIKARKVIVIFDACKSGAALTAFRGVVEQKAIAMLAKSFGLHVISASTAKQYALEITELGHGVLTYTIIEGLKGKADLNNNKIVTVFELIGYIDEKVPQLTYKHFELKQYPVTSRRGMDFPLMVK